VKALIQRLRCQRCLDWCFIPVRILRGVRGGPCIKHALCSPLSSLLFPFYHLSSFDLILFLRKMGLFDKIRRSSRRSAGVATEPPSPPRVPGRDCTKRLPRTVLARIFAFVCPHTVDNTYDTSEESTSDGCMLCDMRDLAHCALVCKRWFLDARALL
jgi:hypothetical protein